jgi:hypothetical protein
VVLDMGRKRGYRAKRKKIEKKRKPCICYSAADTRYRFYGMIEIFKILHFY